MLLVKIFIQNNGNFFQFLFQRQTVHCYCIGRFFLLLFISNLRCMLTFVADGDVGTWCDVQLRKSASDGATELSFLTSYRQTLLYVAISSPATKNSDADMPSIVSADNCIRVRSNIYVDQLADSIAACVSNETDAYTMLVEAVWHSMHH